MQDNKAAWGFMEKVLLEPPPSEAEESEAEESQEEDEDLYGSDGSVGGGSEPDAGSPMEAKLEGDDDDRSQPQANTLASGAAQREIKRLREELDKARAGTFRSQLKAEAVKQRETERGYRRLLAAEAKREKQLREIQMEKDRLNLERLKDSKEEALRAHNSMMASMLLQHTKGDGGASSDLMGVVKALLAPKSAEVPEPARKMMELDVE